MTIGEMSHRSRLSAKPLRLYDTMGLLPSRQTDPATGYRCYAPEQMRDAQLIARLRQLDLPLQRIAAALALEPAAAADEISLFWCEVEADVRARRGLARYLSEWLQGKGQSMFEINTRELPEQKVLSLLKRLHVADLPAFLAAAENELRSHLLNSGLPVTGQTFVVFHGDVNEDSDGPVEVCVPFAGVLEPAGLMRVRLEPARKEAFVSLDAAQVEFPGILSAYDAVCRWIESNGLQIADSPREVYHAPLSGAEPAGCDVAWPFR
jgi:DNA-binding transcriptional MerR regulator